MTRKCSNFRLSAYSGKILVITNLGGDLEYPALQPGVELGRRVLQVIHAGLLGLAAPAG